MEFEIEVKLKSAWMLVAGVALGVAAGYLMWGTRDSLEGVGGEALDRGRGAFEAARARLRS